MSQTLLACVTSVRPSCEISRALPCIHVTCCPTMSQLALSAVLFEMFVGCYYVAETVASRSALSCTFVGVRPEHSAKQYSLFDWHRYFERNVTNTTLRSLLSVNTTIQQIQMQIQRRVDYELAFAACKTRSTVVPVDICRRLSITINRADHHGARPIGFYWVRRASDSFALNRLLALVLRWRGTLHLSTVCWLRDCRTF